LNNLANVITTGLSKSGIGSAIGNIFGGLFGGAKKFATGGFVSNGSGVVDDVPAFLKRGEYVLNQGAVQSLGRGTLDNINNGYFAPGTFGQGTISGKENLLSFATQSATGGKRDFISSLAGGGGLAALEPESGRLSNFARFGDSPIINATQETKEQALGLYYQQLAEEKAFEEQKAAQKKAQKDAIKGMLLNLAISAGTSMIGKGLGSLFGSKEIPFKGGAIRKTSERPFGGSITKLLSSGGSGASRLTPSNSGFGVPFKNALPYVQQLSNPSPYRMSSFDLSNMGKDFLDMFSGRSFSDSINRSNNSPYRPFNDGSYGASLLLPPVTNPGTYRRNSGGAIGGSGDVVPVLASKGEHMINSNAAKKIGYSNLDSLNKGLSPSGEDNSALIAKLDELIQKTQSSNEIKIEINVANSGETSTSSTSSEDAKLLSERLKTVFVQFLEKEQRPGGALYKDKR